MVLQMLEMSHGGNMFSGCPVAAVFIVAPIDPTVAAKLQLFIFLSLILGNVVRVKFEIAERCDDRFHGFYL